MEGKMPYRTLGRTGERVSLVGLGGYHIGVQKEEKESIRIIRTAIDSGINFMDNSWDYNEGLSETRMGRALTDGYRQKVFLMTKIDGQDRKTAENQIHESLSRLRTDRIDLLQFHEIIREGDPDRIFAPGGAIEAVIKARETGKVRFIGFTGHKSPAIHLKMIETGIQHHLIFDAVQMPLNIMDAHFNSFQQKVLPVLQNNDIGVLGMKPFGDRFILESKTVSPVECLHYVMNLPLHVVITGCDSVSVLEQALKAAHSFRPLSGEEQSNLLAKTAGAGASGKYELYKTSDHFDATDRNRQWLGWFNG